MIMIGIETAGLLPTTEMMISTIIDITRVDLLITTAVILMMIGAGLIIIALVETQAVNMTRDNQITDQDQVVTETAIALAGTVMSIAVQTKVGIETQDI
jgi:hypothetical protein